MRRNLFALSAVALTVLVSGQALAGGEGPDKFATQQGAQTQATYGYPGSVSSYSAPSSFRIVRLNELNRSERATIKASATSANVEAVQSSIPADVAAELSAHGVQLNNVIGAASSFSGKTIYYVK